MGMMSEVMDLAVGVIIGAGFGKIVDSVVNDLVMPIVGRVLGNVNFADMFVALKEIPAGTAMTLEAVKKAGVPVFAYGNFMTILLNFAILAFIVFMIVKQMNKLKKDVVPATLPVAEDVLLLREIRDSLKK